MKPKKVKEKLDARIKDYEQTIARIRDPAKAKGYRRPGSLNRRKR